MASKESSSTKRTAHRIARIGCRPRKSGAKATSATMHYCLAQDLPTLVWAANLADIELHTSLSRKKDVARPTMMVFDLDPGAPADIVQCCQVGLWLREILAGMKLKSWAKTSGSKGSASLCPAEHRRYLRTDKGAIARPRGTSGARASQDWSFPKWRKRCGKEKSSSTGARTTSTRRPSASIPFAREIQPTASTPVTWEEVEVTVKKKNGKRLVFRCDQTLARVEKMGDLFEQVATLKQKLPRKWQL